ADCHVAARLGLEMLPHAYAVRGVTETRDREQHTQFELAEPVALGHNLLQTGSLVGNPARPVGTRRRCRRPISDTAAARVVRTRQSRPSGELPRSTCARVFGVSRSIPA